MNLEQLIGIEKKSSASQATCRGFFSEMEKYLNENGFDKEAERFQFSGLPFCGMKPFYTWLITTNEETEFKKLKGCGTVTQNERGITFKAMLSLLCCYINDKRKSPVLNSIVELIGYYSKNKEGKYFGDMNKSFANYFLSELKDDVEYPELKISSPSAKKFLAVMSEALSKAEISKTITENKLENLKTWLISLMPGVQPAGVSESPSKPVVREKTKSDTLHEIAEYLKNLESEKNDLIARLTASSSENSTLAAELEQNKKAGEDLLKTNSRLYAESADLKSGLTEADKRIKVLEEESHKQNAVLNIFEADKKNSQQGQLNAIASKLRTEYDDFTSIKSEEMSIGLGENLRQQMINIFKILEKNGIIIEKR